MLDLAARGIPVVEVGGVDAPGQAVLRLVVALIGDRELNAVKRGLECLHHREDDVFVVVLLDSCEIQICRESALAADEHLPQARSALEGEPGENPALGQELQEGGQDDLFLRDHDVAKPGFHGVALDLRACEHSSSDPS